MDASARRSAGRQSGYLLLAASVITLVNAGNVLTPEANSPLLVGIALVGFALATLTIIIPWASLPPRMPAALVPVALLLIAIGHRLGGDAPYTYAVSFVLAFVWLGIAQPRWTSAMVAPLATGVYVLPYIGDPDVASAALASTVAVIPVCLLVGETIAGALAKLRSAQLGEARRALTLEALINAGALLQDATDHRRIADSAARLATEVLGVRSAAIILTGTVDDVQFTSVFGAPADQSREGWLTVPLTGALRPIGSLLVAPPEGHPDPAFLAQAAALFGVQVARAVENLRVVEALTDAAIRDGLTGVGNRRHAGILLASIRPGDALIVLDLDHFKVVNDRHGHAAGDQTLVSLGQFLRAAVRGGDDVARLGGEEFLIVLRQPADAGAAAARLVEQWRTTRPAATLSAGVEVHAADRAASETMRRADAALYAAKRSGRDRAVSAVELTEDALAMPIPGASLGLSLEVPQP